MEIEKDAVTTIFKQGIKIHVIFLLSLFVIAIVITLQSPDPEQVMPKAILVYLLMVACVYSGRWLGKQFPWKKSWLFLILIFCFLTCFFSVAGIFGMAYFLGYKDGADVSALVVITTLLVMLHVFAGTIITVIRMLTRQQIKESRILQYQAETELNLLTSKLSPHFLFNTLNNMYGLSREDPARVPELLLKLSDLLSYTLYSSDGPFVKLKEEVDCIKNFVALEKIRIGDRLALDVHIGGYNPSINIAPMVLIVFVENAFKHAKNTVRGSIQITLKLWADADFVYFELENTSGVQSAVFDNRPSGMGLVTTIKRLDLLYNDAYQLNHGTKDSRYVVKLKIPVHAAH
ncbi:two-component system LytT family sensor kinase [Pedobacter africanus]|uniref:Sensor histidine kinase YesM n=1 Tax=Pedobacter africanus TaxID=151894 RepID=A0ACC6L0E7_9SPHI|nr:sensor histidine kinase [Pedobacter africanus]MDR6785113.1 sensor histidine kinase YesM [Pedobacter africanus]